MKTKLILSGLLASAMALVFATASFAREEEHEGSKITLQECPSAVQQTAKAQAGDGRIVGVEKYAEESGAAVYEVKVKKSNGEKTEIKISTDGKVLSTKADDEDDDEKPGKKDKDDDDDDKEKKK